MRSTNRKGEISVITKVVVLVPGRPVHVEDPRLDAVVVQVYALEFDLDVPEQTGWSAMGSLLVAGPRVGPAVLQEVAPTRVYFT